MELQLCGSSNKAESRKTGNCIALNFPHLVVLDEVRYQNCQMSANERKSLSRNKAQRAQKSTKDRKHKHCIRAAPLQNEIAPRKNVNFKTECETKSSKNAPKRPRIILPCSVAKKVIHWRFLHSFAPASSNTITNSFFELFSHSHNLQAWPR